MNVDTLEPDHAEVVALLQPYVDGELSDDERDRVALEVEQDPEYQAIVRELAPVELRERILADLDAIEAERSEAEREGWLAPVVGRIRAFSKGALLMIPAAAAAGALFIVANNAGWLSPADGPHIDGGMATSLSLPARVRRATPQADAAADAKAGLPSGAELGELGFAVQVAPPRSLPTGVALVSDSDRIAGSSAMVRYRDDGGAVIVDRQRRAGIELHGAATRYAGHEYHLGRDERGRPWVEFQLGRVHHSLMLEGADARPDAGVSPEEPDFNGLLVVADALRRAHGH